MSDERDIGPLVGDVFQQCSHLAACAGREVCRYFWLHPRVLVKGFTSWATLCNACHTCALIGMPVPMDQEIMVISRPVDLETVEQRN